MTKAKAKANTNTILTVGDRERARKTLDCIGKGLHPDEGLAVLADILGLPYEPRIMGRRMHIDIEDIDGRVERILTEGSSS